jgi:outer membrane protein TolC
LDYETAKKKLVVETAKTYYSLLKDEKNIDLLTLKLDSAKKQLEKDSAGYKNGIVSELNFQRSALSVASAQLDLRQAESTFRTAMVDFLFDMGIKEPRAPVILVDVMEIKKYDLNPIALTDKYLFESADVIKAKNNIENKELALQKTKFTNYGPSVSLSFGVNAAPDSRTKDFSLTDTLRGTVGVSIPIDSWIPNSKSNQSLASLGNEVEKAKIDLESTLSAARDSIFSSVIKLNNYWESIEIARSKVELSVKTYDITERAFNQGNIERLTLEAQRDALAESRQQLLTAELLYKNTVLDLCYALNLAESDL